jgi:hypothetical protein
VEFLVGEPVVDLERPDGRAGRFEHVDSVFEGGTDAVCHRKDTEVRRVPDREVVDTPVDRAEIVRLVVGD